MSDKRTGLFVSLCVVGAFVIWAHAFIAIGYLRRTFTALELAELRFLPAGLIAAVALILFFRRQTIDLFKAHLGRLVLCGVLFVLCYQMAIHYCVAYVSPPMAALLTSFVPLFTLFLASEMLQEPFTVARAFGALIAFDGMFVVVLFGKAGLTGQAVMSLGELPYAVLLTVACLGMAGYSVLAKPMTAVASPLVVNFAVLAVGSLPLIAFVPFNDALMAKATAMSQVEVYALAFLTIVCTLAAYLLWLVGIKHWPASTVNLVSFIIAPLTTFFSWLYFDTPVTMVFFIGGSVILAGIIFATSEDLQRMIRTRRAARASAPAPETPTGD